MEDTRPLAPLPLVQDVLDRLKFNGTFDQFRKTCLSAIEEEPSYRAQKEHVEVLSRRFLHDYETKEMTKNDVRTKLRMSVLEEIKKPGVQASQTMEELVDKTLESKSGDLFKNIIDIIDDMLHPPEPHPPEIHSSDKNDSSVVSNSSDQLVGVAPLPRPTPPTNVTSNKFELPIDLLSLPGLSGSGPVSTIKKEGVKKVSAGKSKPKPTETIAKEIQKKSIKSETGSVKLLNTDKEKIKKPKIDKIPNKEAIDTIDSEMIEEREEENDEKIEADKTISKTEVIEEEEKDDTGVEEKEIGGEEEELIDDTVIDEDNVSENEKDDPPPLTSRPRRSARLASQQQEEVEEKNEEGQEEEEEEEEEKDNRSRRKRRKRVSLTEDEDDDTKRQLHKRQRLEPVRSSVRTRKRVLSSTSSEGKQSDTRDEETSSLKDKDLAQDEEEERIETRQRKSKRTRKFVVST